MSQLTDKYGDVYLLAQNLGSQSLEAKEENGHLTINGLCPTNYVVNQVWDKAKEIDPGLDDGDLTLNLKALRNDIYGEYEVQPGDTLSGIAKQISKGALTYQQIFEANRDILSNPNLIKPGQKLKIPNFQIGKAV
jgi:LysM repeat protein